ncbi:class III signal peptide-containing protein [Candidatus Omnitrophota bacterium]
MFQKLVNKDKQKKGQSTVEYILLFAAIIAVLMVFLAGPFRDSVEGTVTSAGSEVDVMAGRLDGSH